MTFKNPKPWTAWLALGLLALTVLLQLGHLYIEVTGNGKHLEGDIAVATLLILIAVLGLGGFWLLGNMIHGKVLSTTQIIGVVYRLGWHDRDLLASDHFEPPPTKPDLRLVQYDNAE
jgi:hypothetical protein